MTPPEALGPLGHAPLRRAGGVRRTSTLDMTWPDGFAGPLHVQGRARDVRTPARGGPPAELAEDRVDVALHPHRVIADVRSSPPRPELAALVGGRAGGGLRSRLAATVPAERASGTPLYLLLDDLAGASLIADLAKTRWPSNGADALRDPASMAGVCIGFQPGSSALRPGAAPRPRPVTPLVHPDDPAGWHDLPDITEPSTRRARRIDITLTDVLEIDAMFQDSTTVPEGGRVAVHEYRVRATADPATGELLTLVAEPRILPYAECPLAVANLDPLLGGSLDDLRAEVPRTLRGVHGCTHLNDALRALTDVRALARLLPGGR
ncbi:DUF2889 domain-containing protein [Actinomadura sp. LOL_016]|uniref:DUF2889 domain-containing protein n=1 Tax=unclassified Actinomadura TaxID=2626254 RepID=UPI003A80BD61